MHVEEQLRALSAKRVCRDAIHEKAAGQAPREPGSGGATAR